MSGLYACNLYRGPTFQSFKVAPFNQSSKVIKIVSLKQNQILVSNDFVVSTQKFDHIACLVKC